MAHEAAQQERQLHQLYFPPRGTQLYKKVPRGFPMNPQEVNNLVDFINNLHKLRWERILGYKLIMQLYTITKRIMASERDRAMM